MERPVGRYARHSEDCTGIPDVAHVFGACVANTILASEVSSRKQAGHLIASDQVRNLLHPDKWGAVHICNLYAMMKARAEAARLASAMRDRNNNQPPMPGIYPDYAAPVIVTAADGQREMRDMRWGMPSSKKALKEAADKRADKLRAKGTEFDYAELLRMEPDKGTTNVRNTTSEKTGKTNQHWAPWLGPPNRCLVPFTSFSEPDQDFQKTYKPIWFALSDDQPLAFFAGIWTPHECVRKIKTGWEEIEAFAFLTTEPVDPVRTYHKKAMPVILTEPAEWDLWMGDAPWDEVQRLQRPMPEGALQIVSAPPKAVADTADLL